VPTAIRWRQRQNELGWRPNELLRHEEILKVLRRVGGEQKCRYDGEKAPVGLTKKIKTFAPAGETAGHVTRGKKGTWPTVAPENVQPVIEHGLRASSGRKA